MIYKRLHTLLESDRTSFKFLSDSDLDKFDKNFTKKTIDDLNIGDKVSGTIIINDKLQLTYKEVNDMITNSDGSILLKLDKDSYSFDKNDKDIFFIIK